MTFFILLELFLAVISIAMFFQTKDFLWLGAAVLCILFFLDLSGVEL